MSNTTAVILMNLGGPDSQAAVGPYIRNLFADPEMIRLPLGPRARDLFARLVARMRTSSSQKKYALIGGGSPLGEITNRQALELERGLQNGGLDAKVFVGMRYSPPSIEDALSRALDAGCVSVVALPLYPQQCSVTTGSSFRALESALSGSAYDGAVTWIDSYATHPLYVEAVAQTVRDALNRFDSDVRSRATVLFSAHSIPLKTADGGDPYPDQIRSTVAAVVERLPEVKHALAFQSRVGPVRWVGPDTDEEFVRLAQAGTDAVVVVPLGFVSDHLETLYDLDIKLQAVAERENVQMVRARALNTDEGFIGALCDLVQQNT